MNIKRAISVEFDLKVRPGKVLILLGARRVGKTFFLKEYIKNFDLDEMLMVNGEDQKTIDAFSERSGTRFKQIIGRKKYLIIDEAQNIPDIGKKLKLFVDELPHVCVVATGSSMFELHHQLGEPLVGRSHIMYMYPLSQMEFSIHEDYLTTTSNLEERMIYGSYPELLNCIGFDEKVDYLENIVNSYLLRDILAYDGIKKANKIMDLLRLIAFQVGKEVSIDELANNLKSISRNTVESYLDLLSKVFVIYPVRGFSRNLRKEISKSNRWFFYDNGIRNAIIRNYNFLKSRNDIGQLWENYLMVERLKYNSYTKNRVNSYFWRTYDQQEIDLIEEKAEDLAAYEFKWTKKKTKMPGAWSNNYPESTYKCINTDNYLDFIT